MGKKRNAPWLNKASAERNLEEDETQTAAVAEEENPAQAQKKQKKEKKAKEDKASEPVKEADAAGAAGAKAANAKAVTNIAASDKPAKAKKAYDWKSPVEEPVLTTEQAAGECS